MGEFAGACLKPLEGRRGLLDVFCTGQGHLGLASNSD